MLSHANRNPESFEFNAKLERIRMNQTIFKGLSSLAQFASYRMKFTQELVEIKDKLLGLEDTKLEVVDQAISDMAFRFWYDKGIEEVWNKVHQYIEEEQSLLHYMSNKNIFDEDYKMTINDWLHARDYSKVISEHEIVVDRVAFRFHEMNNYSIGENKKLFQSHFDTAYVTFVVDSQEYDMDHLTNKDHTRLHEALDAFEEILNNPALNSDSMILLLNKTDLLREKLKTKPLLKTQWPDFELAVDESGIDRHISNMKNESELEKYFDDTLSYFTKKFTDKACKATEIASVS